MTLRKATTIMTNNNQNTYGLREFEVMSVKQKAMLLNKNIDIIKK